MKYFYCFLFLFIAGSPMFADAGNDQGCVDTYELEESTPPDIEEETLHEILSLAAPYYNYIPEQFIRLYYHCNCIEVTEIGVGLYRVEYGGIGIEILIDVSAAVPLDQVFNLTKFILKD